MPIRHHFACRETIATILADRPEDISAACRGLEQARTEVEEYIRQDPFFQTTFDPIPVRTSSRIIRGMADAAAAAGVGPMAAVAGAVATAALQAVRQDCRYCVIDNGGDIALRTDRPVRIGLYAGDSPLSGRYAFVLQPDSGIYGVCTSSATVGHSISLGSADSVTVFGPDPVLADAVATAVCNLLTPDDLSCLDRLGEGVDGIFSVFDEKSISWGTIPPLIRARVDERLITSGPGRVGRTPHQERVCVSDHQEDPGDEQDRID